MSILKKKKENADGAIRYKQTAGDRVFNIVNYTVFALLALICFFPFYYLLINTISSNELVTSGSITWRPIDIQFDTYIDIMTNSVILRAFTVTIGRTVLGTALMVLASAFIGYLVTKQEMFARKVVYRIILITMYFNAGLIPWFLTIRSVGLLNNFWAYIIPGIVAPYNIILVKTYIESIPAELEESAKIDGASYMTIFRKLILPLSKPILATIAIFGAVGHWNSFQDSLILMASNTKLHTLQHVLKDWLDTQVKPEDMDSETIREMLSMRTRSIAVSMVSILPICCVYPFMMRYFEKGIMIGAVKG